MDRSAVSPARRRPSMRDVARVAGVSVGTVSYSLNLPGRVSEATRRRVLDAIEELGFVPNSLARSVKSGHGIGLGVVVGDLRYTFSIDVARGVQAGARDEGTTVLIANGDTDMVEQSKYVQLFDQARMDGIILSSMYDSHDDIERLRSHGSPVVVVNYRSSPLDHCMVLMDNVAAGSMAANHLLDLGCRRLAWVTREGVQPLDERGIGISSAVAAAPGATVTPWLIERTDYANGRAVARLMCMTPAAGDMPDGIISGTALVARGIIDELNQHSPGRVPRDIRLISTENDQQADSGEVRLSVIRAPAFDMGRAAARLVMAEVRGGAEGHTHEVLTFPPTLLAYSSSLGASADSSSQAS